MDSSVMERWGEGVHPELDMTLQALVGCWEAGGNSISYLQHIFGDIFSFFLPLTSFFHGMQIPGLTV